MKLNVICGKEATACIVIGVVGGMIFLFVFPKGSISTLMHEVLHLPGPGAGIALILGPFLIIVALISSILSRGSGGAVVASSAFAIACAVAGWLFEIPVDPKGAFGSPMFIAGVIAFSIAAEAVLALGRALKQVWRSMLSGALANTVLLGFYWLAVFPRTYKWIGWGDVPLLMGLCLASGLASGYVAWAVSRPLSRALALKEKE